MLFFCHAMRWKLVILVLMGGIVCVPGHTEIVFPGRPATESPRKFLLFVGINAFNLSETLTLQYCVADARILYEEITSEGDASTLLVDQDASRENILREISNMINISTKGDFILMYISTHGVVDFNDFFLLPSDADPNNIFGTGIPASMIINAFSMAVKDGVNILLVFDTSYSGNIGFDPAKSLYVEGGKTYGLSLLFSSSPLETAVEGPQFGGGHGAFSHFLITGLRGDADRNNDSSVTLREMFDFAYSGVKEATENSQNPILIGMVPNDLVIKRMVHADADAPSANGSSDYMPDKEKTPVIETR